MFDRAGNELFVGDEVLYLETNRNGRVNLVWGTIDRLTEKRVVFRVDHTYTGTRTCPPDRVVKPAEE